MNYLYLSSVLWYLSWPVLIFISYGIILLAVKNFENKINKKCEPNQ